MQRRNAVCWYQFFGLKRIRYFYVRLRLGYDPTDALKNWKRRPQGKGPRERTATRQVTFSRKPPYPSHATKHEVRWRRSPPGAWRFVDEGAWCCHRSLRRWYLARPANGNHYAYDVHASHERREPSFHDCRGSCSSASDRICITVCRSTNCGAKAGINSNGSSYAFTDTRTHARADNSLHPTED